MENPSNSRKWITCGVIAVVVLCIGAVIAFGGLAWIGSLLEDVPTGIVENDSVDDNDFPTPDALGDTTSGLGPTPTLDAQVGNAAIPFEAVVQIIAFYLEDGEYVEGWTGSGTVITPQGLILTNAHVVLPDRYFDVDKLAVAFTTQEDQAPEPAYYVDVLQADAALDIAVLQITSDLDENSINPAELNLPFVPLGNADDLRLGDTVTILGYPGIGGETITLTRGEVSGFTSEAGRGDRAFIKTSATIAGGNSGGLAADENGYLIGVPTQLGYGGDDQFVDCRVLADTNRDGQVNEDDSCIPTGGFINALRPINLAIPLIEAAQEGTVHVVEGYEAPLPTTAGFPEAGEILFADDFSTEDNNWALESESGKVFYANGELNFQLWSDYVFLWQYQEDSYSDVIVDLDVSVVSPGGDGDFGVICRYQDNENFYGLEVSEDGYYSIWKVIAGEIEYILEWRNLPFEVEYANNIHINAACVGSTLSLAVDGELLAEVVDKDLKDGSAGMIAGTYEAAELTIGFDNLVISAPED
ncbi:MAG: serine protease [Chloroflexota bacterium]